MTLRRVVVGLALLVLPLTCTPSASASSSVVGGQGDAGAHPYVAMLVPPGGSGPTCTGVLVRSDYGARAVVTAAHCLTTGSARSGSGWSVVFADRFTPDATRYAASWQVSSRYAPSSSYRHDLGVLVLSSTPLVRPAALATVGRTDRHPDATVTTVGTGSPYTGQRRSATERVVSRDASWLYLRPGTGNSCSGDSGGPDLAPGTDVVLALTDQGTCSRDQDLRVDTSEAHDLVVQVTRALRPVITAQPQATTVQDGAAATFTASASGASSAVQWYSSADDGSSWSPVAGATSPTLQVTARAEDDGDLYVAVFTNSASTATTSPATLSVTPAPAPDDSSPAGPTASPSAAAGPLPRPSAPSP